MIIEKFIFLCYNELHKLEFEEACDENNQGGYNRVFVRNGTVLIEAMSITRIEAQAKS